MKKGDTLLVDTAPLKPALHVQPAGTLAPVLLAGQATAVQLLLKNGLVEVAATEPLKPLLQVHPNGTPVPVLLAGQVTALQVLVK